MDSNAPSPTPRKVRFTPKAPPLRKPKPTVPNAEKADDNQDDEAEQASLVRRASEHLAGRGPKVEKKSSVQVAFAHGAASSTQIRTFGKPREGNGDKTNDYGSTDSARDNRQIVISSPSTAGTSGSSVNAMDASSQKVKDKYNGPWDYERTYYPITLPWRRPYSGDPELLDEAEFGEASEEMEYNENTINAAEELGLLEEKEEARMFFIQLPTCGDRADVSGKQISLGGTVASATAKGKEKEGISSSILRKGNSSNMGCSLEDLPGGDMGKMLVYKSGAVKWKLGETLYDVSPGIDRSLQQDVVAINTIDKDCCMLGKLGERAVLVTPQIDFLLDNGMNSK